MVELVLKGCKVEPLLSYFKGIGLLRLVGEQADPGARGHWAEVFVLRSVFDEASLLDFFLDHYVPTPLVAPWNGGSGFHPKDKAAQEILRAIERTADARFSDYRQVIGVTRRILADVGVTSKGAPAKKSAKADLIARCRAYWPDKAVRWLDAACVVTGPDLSFAPLLGTGGIDLRFEFTSNFMRNLVGMLAHAVEPSRPDRRRRREVSRALLRAALLAEDPVPLAHGSPGQLHPGNVEMPGGTEGFEGRKLVNPWDYVLALEGLLLMAGSVARRLAVGGTRTGSFPFTVEPVAAGAGDRVTPTVEEMEGEVWLPLWNRPAGIREVAYLFSEGRAQWGRRQARTGTDFAKAALNLGVARGVHSFLRYARVKRSGRAHLMAPLGRILVRTRPQPQAADLLREPDPWVMQLRRACRPANKPPSRYVEALRSIDGAMLMYCTQGGPGRLQDVLVALGKAERALALAGGWPRRAPVPPLQHLSPGWLAACDDGSPEFRLAAAAASVGWGRHRDPANALRVNLEAVKWDDRRRTYIWGERTGTVVWDDRHLPENLGGLLVRRLIEQEARGLVDLPLDGAFQASLEEVQAFINGGTDDSRLSFLIPGLATLRWRRSAVELPTRQAPVVDLSPAYALLKLLFLPGGLHVGGRRVPIRAEVEVATSLRAGDLLRAVTLAMRRLRSCGLTACVRNAADLASGSDPRRLAAALLFPISERSAQILADLILR